MRLDGNLKGKRRDKAERENKRMVIEAQDLITKLTTNGEGREEGHDGRIPNHTKVVEL